MFDGGFSSTEADKTKKYKLYLEEYYAEKLETLSNVDAAAVTLDLPDEDGTILSKGEQAYVTAILTLNGTMDDEQAAGLQNILRQMLEMMTHPMCSSSIIVQMFFSLVRMIRL